MGFDLQRAAVVTGDGVVARYPGVLCVAWCTDREPLRRLLEICADTAGPEPGRALARRLVTWLAGPETPGEALVFGTVAAAGEQIAVFLSGTAGVEVAGTGLAVSGADSASWTDRLLPRPDTALVLALDGTAASGATDVGLFDLREGVVPGAGVVLLPGADPGSGAGSSRAAEPGWGPSAERSSAPVGYGGYAGDPVAAGSGGSAAGHDELSSYAVAEEPAARRSELGTPSRRSRRLAGRHLSPEPEPEPVATGTDRLDTPAAGVPAARPPLEAPVTPAHAVPAVPSFLTPEQAAASHPSNGNGDLGREYEGDLGQPDALHALHTNGYTETGYAENGYAENGHADNGYPENGYSQNGYANNGYAENGYANNGYPQNGYPQNGYPQNGYSQNGYPQNGYAENGYAENGSAGGGYGENNSFPHSAYPTNGYAQNGFRDNAQDAPAPAAEPEEQEEEDFSAGEWFDAGSTGPGPVSPPTEAPAAVWTEPEQVPPAQEPPTDQQETTQQQPEQQHGDQQRGEQQGEQQLSEPVTPVTPALPTSSEPLPEDPGEEGDAPVPPVVVEQIMGGAPGDTPRIPLEVGSPGGVVAQVDVETPAGEEGVAPQAQGHLCARGHLNDPRALFCVLCGIRMNERTGVLVVGARPPLGMIVFDDGATYTVDAEYLVGRMPEADPRVRSGALKSIVIEDRTGAVSRVHAEIRVNGWDVLLSDSGSRNGTFVAGASETGWTPLAPGRGRRLVPGTRVRIGGRSFVFESPSGAR